MNERLRTVMLQRSVTPGWLAAECQVDPKTVERWINPGRLPHRKHRWLTATLLSVDEAYLWPDAHAGQGTAHPSDTELIRFYPRRASVPVELWRRLCEDAVERIDVLVYAGLFLPEQYPDFPKLLVKKAEAGVKVRLLFGDPDAPAVLVRSQEEGIGDAIPFKIRNTLVHYRAVLDCPGVELRLHATTLYNSLYRFDSEMLVNTHVYGIVAAHAPVLHLRHLSGGELFETYIDSLEQVWVDSKPGQEAAI